MQKILKLGVVPYEVGLTWIIREIFKDGDKVNPQDLPDFLDKKAKLFLIKRARDQENIQTEICMQESSKTVFGLHFLKEEDQLRNEGILYSEEVTELDQTEESPF